jgi:hypothetical protein
MANTIGLKFGWFPHLCAIHTFYPTLITYQPMVRLLASFSTEMTNCYTKPQTSQELITSLLNLYPNYQNSGDHFEHLMAKPILFSKQDLHPPSPSESTDSEAPTISFGATTLHTKLLLKSGKIDISAVIGWEALNNFWIHRRLNPTVLREYVLRELDYAKIAYKTNHMEYPFAADIVLTSSEAKAPNIAVFVDDIDSRLVGAEHASRLDIELSKIYFRAKKWKVLEINEQHLPKLLEIIDASRK